MGAGELLFLLKGLQWTLALSAIAFVTGTLTGLAIALLRSSGFRAVERAAAGYIALFQGVSVPKGSRVDYRASYQITMASLAATRLFAAAGAGGIALTAWAVRRSGMQARTVACRMIALASPTTWGVDR